MSIDNNPINFEAAKTHFDGSSADGQRGLVALQFDDELSFFRSLLSQYCSIPLAQETPVPTVDPEIDATPAGLPEVVNTLLEGWDRIAVPKSRDQERMRRKLAVHILSFYALELGPELFGRVSQTILTLTLNALHEAFQLPQDMEGAVFDDEASGRGAAFQAAVRRVEGEGDESTSHQHYVVYCRAPFAHPGKQEIQDPIFLPREMSTMANVVLRRCPVDPATGTMDAGILAQLIKQDVEGGLKPLLLMANVGPIGKAFSDPISELHQIAKEHNMNLHFEGPGLALLQTEAPIIEDVRASLVDPEVHSSFVVSHREATLSGTPPTVSSYIMFITSKDGPEDSSIDFARLLGLYLQLKVQGAGALRKELDEKQARAFKMQQVLANVEGVQLLTQPNNYFNICFRYFEPELDVNINDVNDLLLTAMGGPSPGLAMKITDSTVGGVLYFHYSMMQSSTESIDSEVVRALFDHCHEAFTNVKAIRPRIEQRIEAIDSLMLMNMRNGCWPMGVEPPIFTATCFRLVPPFYRVLQHLNTDQVGELNMMNSRMGDMLAEKYPSLFVTLEDSHGLKYIALTSSCNNLNDTPLALDMEEGLGALISQVVDKLEADDQVIMMIQTEMTKKGIEAAEKLLKEKMKEEEEQESGLKYIPVLGSLMAWIYPPKPYQPESLNFDLRTLKLRKDAAAPKPPSDQAA